jgi:hypothetical protein
MQKRQNTRRSIADSVHTIYRHGMFVNAGFILGFDSETGSVARGVIQCIEDTCIPVNMTGLLTALPTTQLTRRLAKAGRLPERFDVAPEGDGDQCTGGLNYVTCRPRAEILRDYLQVIETVYTPRAYFDRVSKVSRMLDSSHRRFRQPFWHRRRELRGFFRMARKLGFRKETRGPFWRTLVASAWANPRSLRYTGALIALYLHFGPFSKYVAERIRQAIAREEAHPSPVAPPPPAVSACGAPPTPKTAAAAS